MITLNDIKKPLPFNISVGLSGISIQDVAENTYGDEWDFDVFLPSIGKNLQRPLVWTLEQKQALVLSVFKDTYIPPVCLVQERDRPGIQKTLYQIIDGKQRLNAMISYYNNEFPIIVKEQEYYYKDLPEVLQKQYARYNFLHSVAYSYNYSEDVKIIDQHKIDWFMMINFAGTAQEIEHMNNLKAK